MMLPRQEVEAANETVPATDLQQNTWHKGLGYLSADIDLV